MNCFGLVFLSFSLRWYFNASIVYVSFPYALKKHIFLVLTEDLRAKHQWVVSTRYLRENVLTWKNKCTNQHDKFYGQENKKGFRDLNIFTQQALLHSDRTRIASSNSGHPTIFNKKNKIKEDRVLLYLTKHYLL